MIIGTARSNTPPLVSVKIEKKKFKYLNFQVISLICNENEIAINTNSTEGALTELDSA